jgi:hypothetical protein
LLTHEAENAYLGDQKAKTYEPVLYEVVKDAQAANKDREGLTSI